MAIAIISDIHSNIEALDAVLDDISEQEQKHGITEIHCLGDIVGYGPDPIECIRSVREHCTVVIGGSHEESVCYVSREVMPQIYNDDAVPSILWTRHLLYTQAIDLMKCLAKLPHIKLPNGDDAQKLIAEVHGTLCHALRDGDDKNWKKRHPNNSPHGAIACACINNYATISEICSEGGENLSRCFSSLQEIKRAACFVGHVHNAEAFSWNPEEPDIRPVPFNLGDDFKRISRAEVQLVDPLFYVINPGSVGQPRDHDPRASYCIYSGDKVIYRRVPYDYPETMHKIMNNSDLTKATRANLAARLRFGI